jgi:hypothetical protein
MWPSAWAAEDAYTPAWARHLDGKPGSYCTRRRLLFNQHKAGDVVSRSALPWRRYPPCYPCIEYWWLISFRRAQEWKIDRHIIMWLRLFKSVAPKRKIDNMGASYDMLFANQRSNSHRNLARP